MVRHKGVPLRALAEVNYSDPSVVFWFFGQVPSKRARYCSPSLSTTTTTTTSSTSNTVKNTVKEEEHKGDKRKGIDPQRNYSLVHPLALHPDLPPLTDLQAFISEAIISDHNSSSFEKIYEYVSKRWRYIKRRDGSNYTTDCKRAIQANLRHNPNHIALFKRDKKQEGHWTVCTTLEDAIEASKERQAEKRAAQRQRDRGMLEMEDKGESSSDEDELEKHEGSEDSPRNEREQESGSEKDKSEEDEEESILEDIEEKVESEHEEKRPSDEKSESFFTPLQDLICECINDNGPCHFDMIVHHVSKNWNKIKSGSAEQDVKAAVLGALTDSKRLFKRDTKRTGWWIINAGEQNQDESPSKRAFRGKGRYGYQNLDVPKRRKSDAIENSDEDEKEDKNRDPPMTELQILIIEAIDSNDGSASFEQIFDHVNQSFENLRRRDGTPYTSECRRAIQASLSNNPSTRPFFKKEVKNNNTFWSLAKRSIEFLSDYKAKKESEGEEFIRKDSEDQEDKQAKSKQGPKDDRHLYANRVKRARRIKEKAEGKRPAQLRDLGDATDRARKRRK